MFRTLYSKLAFVLTGLFCLVGLSFAAVTVFSTDMYRQEVNQKLNRNLAQHIVNEKLLIKENQVNEEALKEIFHMLMVINPSIEIYLLDTEGKILSYSAPPGKVKRKEIDLAPVIRWLDGNREKPVLGEDPRNPEGKKVFTAAPIYDREILAGYLYVILGGEIFDSVALKIKKSFIVRLSLWIIFGSILFAIVAGLILFAMLTGRLRKLAGIMDSFRSGDKLMIESAASAEGTTADEIDRLTASFRTMARHINDQMERLRKSDVMRRELVANVSHDLKTPLATLRGYMETLLLKEDNLTADKRREYLGTAINHCVRLNELVNELFELARLDSDEIKPDPESFNINELVSDLTQKFSLRLKEKDLTADIDFEKEAFFVTADIALIERALENLIENAVSYSERGGKISLKISSEKESIIICITNSGGIIPEEDLPFIFDRFFQSSKRTGDNKNHSGLGLAITKKILELHKSGISVSSSRDTGTSFCFPLPASRI